MFIFIPAGILTIMLYVAASIIGLSFAVEANELLREAIKNGSAWRWAKRTVLGTFKWAIILLVIVLAFAVAFVYNDSVTKTAEANSRAVYGD